MPCNMVVGRLAVLGLSGTGCYPAGRVGTPLYGSPVLRDLASAMARNSRTGMLQTEGKGFHPTTQRPAWQPQANGGVKSAMPGPLAGALRARIQPAAQKLMTTITSFPGDLAATPDGRNWVIKALHPSDPSAISRGMPDPSSCPNVVLAYYNVFRLSPPSGTTDPWGFDLTVMPNLLVPGYYRTLASDGVTTLATGNFLNSAFMTTGQVVPIYSSLFANFMATGIEAHRLIGLGITAYQDGPALANQGTLTAAQWQVARQKFHACPDYNMGAIRIAKYQAPDEASYDTSQHMPNAYFGESKDGCYMPLRLGSTCDRWVTSADLEYCAGPGLGYQLPIAASAGAANAPFPSLTRVYTTGGSTSGDLVFAPLNPIWGGISARNLSPQTSFAFYVRMTIEARVNPISVLAPQQSMSPTYDPVALASYFRISRELKDAYPADYNDWGKLWEVIKGAAKAVLPVLSVIPGPVGAIATGIHAGVNAVDSIVTRKSAPRDTPPAAQVQRQADVVAAQRVASVPRQRVTRRRSRAAVRDRSK